MAVGANRRFRQSARIIIVSMSEESGTGQSRCRWRFDVVAFQNDIFRMFISDGDPSTIVVSEEKRDTINVENLKTKH